MSYFYRGADPGQGPPPGRWLRSREKGVTPATAVMPPPTPMSPATAVMPAPTAAMPVPTAAMPVPTAAMPAPTDTQITADDYEIGEGSGMATGRGTRDRPTPDPVHFGDDSTSDDNRYM